MLDLDHLACDACRLRRLGDGAKNVFGMLPHACVLSRRILKRLPVGREPAKGRRDRQYRNSPAKPPALPERIEAVLQLRE